MSEPAASAGARKPGQLNMDRFRALLLDSAGIGLAVSRPDNWSIILHNPTFALWFPSIEEGATLPSLLPAFSAEAVLERLAAGRAWKTEVEIKPGRRTLTLAVELLTAEGGDGSEVLVQCQNISKLKELEYMIESYSKMIERQNRDLRREKERVEKLLLNIMPKQVYDEWKQFGVTTPTRFEEATVLMLDFIGFTQLSVAHDPPKLISELNDIFTAFDRIVEQFGCERLKTIGDAYLAVSGLPEPNPDHARNIARVALRFVRFLKRRNASSEIEWKCRVGISSLPVVGSVVGVQKYVYDIFGPGVNLAARLEPLCGPMEILMSADTARQIDREFRLTSRGHHEIRGFGEKEVFQLLGDLEAANDSLPEF